MIDTLDVKSFFPAGYVCLQVLVCIGNKWVKKPTTKFFQPNQVSMSLGVLSNTVTQLEVC